MYLYSRTWKSMFTKSEKAILTVLNFLISLVRQYWELLVGQFALVDNSRHRKMELACWSPITSDNCGHPLLNADGEIRSKHNVHTALQKTCPFGRVTFKHQNKLLCVVTVVCGLCYGWIICSSPEKHICLGWLENLGLYLKPDSQVTFLAPFAYRSS